jgi:single-strand DNA-binding protein
MNSVNITGRVGADIELRYTPQGKAVAEMNLAVDDGFGESKKVVWITVTIWDKAAEVAQKYIHKGDMVGITGRLSQDTWEDKTTGKKQSKIRVTSEQMTLLPNEQRERIPAPAPRQPAPTHRNAAPAPATEPAQDFDDSDDIPF